MTPELGINAGTGSAGCMLDGLKHDDFNVKKHKDSFSILYSVPLVDFPLISYLKLDHTRYSLPPAAHYPYVYLELLRLPCVFRVVIWMAFSIPLRGAVSDHVSRSILRCYHRRYVGFSLPVFPFSLSSLLCCVPPGSSSLVCCFHFFCFMPFLLSFWVPIGAVEARMLTWTPPSKI